MKIFFLLLMCSLTFNAYGQSLIPSAHTKRVSLNEKRAFMISVDETAPYTIQCRAVEDELCYIYLYKINDSNLTEVGSANYFNDLQPELTEVLFDDGEYMLLLATDRAKAQLDINFFKSN